MSLHAYSSKLRPERCLRLIVLASAACLALAGTLIALRLPAAPPARGALLIGWCWLCGRELLQLASSFARLRALCIDATGSIRLSEPDGTQVPATLMPGSIVLDRIAWLRCLTADGRIVTEPFRGAARTSRDWRRLKVIWRHAGVTP